MTVTSQELATRIVNRLDNEMYGCDDTQRAERIKIVTEEVEKIFRMAQDTIQHHLRGVRICDD